MVKVLLGLRGIGTVLRRRRDRKARQHGPLLGDTVHLFVLVAQVHAQAHTLATIVQAERSRAELDGAAAPNSLWLDRPVVTRVTG